MNFLITGGAGFIGSAVCRHICSDLSNNVTNVDKLTYAGNLASLRAIENQHNYRFEQADVCDDASILAILKRDEIDVVMHLAAESHVDRSIDSPAAFIETNVIGTFRMLNAALEYYRGLPAERKERFRFHHISTDEVFGDLPFDSGIFTEETPYAPSPPTPPPRQRRTIWCAPGTRPTGCPSFFPIAPTITGRSISRRNSSRS
jgi:dTDP-glucose 4,6-dehydratase